MHFGQFQPPIRHTLDRKTTQIWLMEYKHPKLWLLLLILLLSFDVFIPTSAHPLLLLDKNSSKHTSGMLITWTLMSVIYLG